MQAVWIDIRLCYWEIIWLIVHNHYNDVIMTTMASQITSPTIGYSTVYSGGNQRKHQSSASLAFVRGIHRWPVNSPHKRSVTRKMFPFDGVIMIILILRNIERNNAVHIAAVQLYMYNETKRQSRSKKLGVKRNNWHHCIDHQISSYRKVICQLSTSKDGS